MADYRLVDKLAEFNIGTVTNHYDEDTGEVFEVMSFESPEEAVREIAALLTLDAYISNPEDLRELALEIQKADIRSTVDNKVIIH